MNLYDILACPHCKVAVVRQTPETLVCSQCRRTYPIINNVPVLLPDGSTAAPYDHAVPLRTNYDPWLPRVVLQSLTADAIILELGAGNITLSVPNIIRMDITLTPHVDVVGDAHALPFLPETFSFIFSSAVIEHLRQPFLAAQEMDTALRNGGYLYGECAFIFPYHGHPHHYFNASHSGMEEVFKSLTRLRVGVGPHQGPSFAIEALLTTYLFFLDPYSDAESQSLKHLLRQVLAQPLRAHDLKFSQEAALVCCACNYFFGVKAPQASVVIPAVLQSLYHQSQELQQRFPHLFDLAFPENIMAWAHTADRQQYPALAEHFDTLVPFRKDESVSNGDVHLLRREPIAAPGLPPLTAPPQHSLPLLTNAKHLLQWDRVRRLAGTAKHAVGRTVRMARSFAGTAAAPSSWSLVDITDNGERVTHLYPNDCYYAHLSLYEFAVPFVQSAVVLDAGSGTGYGAAHLADHGARFVYGIDASNKAVAFSHHHFPRPNLSFHTMSLEKIYGFREQQFDVVFCSNVLEHISDAPAFLRMIWRLLKPDGTFIVAVPPIINDAIRAQDLANPYHVNIWSPRQWSHVLSQYFAEVQAYQHWYDKPGVELNLLNAPGETVVTEKDFIFPALPTDQLYHQPTITAIFAARKPVLQPQLPKPGAPVWFVDDSFTRAPALAPSAPWNPLLTRAWTVARQQGVRTLGHKTRNYLLRKLREQRVA